VQPSTDFHIFPNPARDYVSVNIAADTSTDIEVRFIDNKGKTRVQQKTVGKGNMVFQLYLSDIPPGIYYVEVIKNGQTQRQQIIKL